MARPIDADPAETRERILSAAVRLFALSGFHGASTRELAEAARVNVATLSYYFGGKQGVYDAAVDEVYRRLLARAQSALAGAPLDDPAAVVTRLYDAARAERDGIRLLVRQVLDHGGLTAHTEARHFLPGLASTGELVAGRLGCTPAQARDAVVALGYLISRYVIQDDGSLKRAFGVRTAAEAHRRVVATLCTAAAALVAPARARHKKKEPS